MFGHATAAVEMAADAGNAAGGGRLRYAGFWARVAALIVDNAIVTLFCLVSIAGASNAGDAAVLVAMAVCSLTALLYWPLLECSVRQATFGKQLLGMQVTDLEGGRLSFGRSLLRNLAKIVSSLLLGTGFLLAGFTVRKQALHDTIAGCLVVRMGPAHQFKAVAASIAGLIVIFGGCYYLAVAAYIPQALDQLEKQMRGTGALLQKGLDKAMKAAQPDVPAAVPQPAAATPPAAAPVPQTATATPPVPSPAPPVVAPIVVVAPESPPVAASTPAAPSKSAIAPVPKEAVAAPPVVASAPTQPAAALVAPAKPPTTEAKTAPKEAIAAPPAAASASTQPAAAPAAPVKPIAVEAKPAPAKPAAETRTAATPAKKATPAVKPEPAPERFAELVSEPPAERPPPAPRTTVPRPAPEGAAPVPAAPSRIVITPKYNDVMTAVMYRDAAAITQLLDLGWWVDRRDTNGVSPLMAAAWNGDLELVQLLLQRGADPNLHARGGSVLEYGSRSGDARIMDTLKKAGAR